MARWWKRPPVGAAGVGPTPLRYVATPRIAIPPDRVPRPRSAQDVVGVHGAAYSLVRWRGGR